MSASGNTEEKHFPSGVSNGWLQIYAFNGEVKQLLYRFGTANTNDYQIFVRTFYTPSQSWSNWTRLITNSDLREYRFKPIEVNGYSGQTFKSILKDKCDNAVNFVVFRSNASNPITDNPFSFVNGYAIVFNSIALAPSNSLMILGTSDGSNAVIESRRLDLRS